MHAARPGDHVRAAGGDLAPGDPVFGAGTVLGPAHVGVLASLGFHKVEVVSRARVGVLDRGTVMTMSGLGSLIRPCRSAAVWWLRTAPGPARSSAAHSAVSRVGSPEKLA